MHLLGHILISAGLMAATWWCTRRHYLAQLHPFQRMERMNFWKHDGRN